MSGRKVCAEDGKAGADQWVVFVGVARMCGGWRPWRGGLAPPKRVRVWAAATVVPVSRLMGGDRVCPEGPRRPFQGVITSGGNKQPTKRPTNFLLTYFPQVFYGGW